MNGTFSFREKLESVNCTNALGLLCRFLILELISNIYKIFVYWSSPVPILLLFKLERIIKKDALQSDGLVVEVQVKVEAEGGVRELEIIF